MKFTSGRFAFVAIACLLLPTFAAMAQSPSGIYVEYYVPPVGNPCGTNPPSVGDGWFAVPGFASRGSTCPGATTQAGLPYGSNVSFTGASGAYYRVFAVSSSQAIGNITVGGSGYTLIVGQSTNSNPPFTNGAGALVVAGGSVIGNISATGGTVQVYATDIVGTVDAATVVRVDATNAVGSVTSSGTIGTVRAPSLAAVTATGNITAVRVENWNSGDAPSDQTGVISSSTGNIGTVLVRDARLLGAVKADQGSIGTILTEIVTPNDPSVFASVGPVAGSPVTIRAMDGITSIVAPSINADITSNYNGNGTIRKVLATNGNFAGSLRAAVIGETTDPSSGLYLTNGQLDADITLAGNLWGELSVDGTIPGGIAVPAGRAIRIGAGIQSPSPVTLDGELRGQVIINTNNASQVWAGATTINGHTITPDSNFEFSQTSDDLGGGAIGMAPFRVWASDCNPVSKDNDVIGAGDGLFVTDLSDANVKPIKIRFYGPIKKGSGYATWNDAFWIECRPLNQTGAARCAWYPADEGFDIEGPSDTETDVTLARTISIGRAASVYPKPGIYRVIPKMNAAYEINSVLSRDVDDNPETVWPSVCGTPIALLDDVSPPESAYAYVFRIKPNCDAIKGDTQDDEQQVPPPDCSTDCTIADVNQSGMVTVQDIFDFLNYYFAGDPRADVNDSGAVSVQDIFDFLAAYFSCEL